MRCCLVLALRRFHFHQRRRWLSLGILALQPTDRNQPTMAEGSARRASQHFDSRAPALHTAGFDGWMKGRWGTQRAPPASVRRHLRRCCCRELEPACERRAPSGDRRSADQRARHKSNCAASGMRATAARAEVAGAISAPREALASAANERRPSERRIFPL